MRVAICDDEAVFLEQMEQLLEHISEIEKVDKYTDLNELEQYLLNHQEYDIIFMDIEWNKTGENGTDYAARINERYPNIQIIFMTAYNELFSEAIFWKQINLCGYLVKPIKYEKLQILITKAKQNMQKNQREVLLVQRNGVTEALRIADILYMESRAHQVYIATINERITIYKKIDDYEQILEHCFVRIHKSFFVNMNHIAKLDRTDIILNNQEKLPVSKAKFPAAKTKYFRFMGEAL